MKKPTSKLKLLLVDDDESIRNVMGSLLRNEGFEVLTANSGNNALELLATHISVDLILSDIDMADGTGFDLMKRSRSLLEAPPIVFISGNRSFNWKFFEDYGVRNFFQKPVRIPDLLDFIHKFEESKNGAPFTRMSISAKPELDIFSSNVAP